PRARKKGRLIGYYDELRTISAVAFSVGCSPENKVRADRVLRGCIVGERDWPTGIGRASISKVDLGGNAQAGDHVGENWWRAGQQRRRGVTDDDREGTLVGKIQAVNGGASDEVGAEGKS